MKWQEIDQQVCSVARALSVVGERWTLLIIRDAFKGTHRFDQFQANLGVTRHRLAERLARLVEQGILTRVPYQERPVRYEYLLTRKGLALYPVMATLSHWADEWIDDGNGPPLTYRHTRCGKETQPVVVCSACREPLRPAEVVSRHGVVLEEFLAHCLDCGAPVPEETELPRAAAGFVRVPKSDSC